MTGATKMIRAEQLASGDELVHCPTSASINFDPADGYTFIVDTMDDCGSGMCRMWLDVLYRGHEHRHIDYMFRDASELVEVVA